MVTPEELIAAQNDPKSDVPNLYFRAGVLIGIALLDKPRKLDDEDRLLLARIAGSLIEYAKTKEQTNGEPTAYRPDFHSSSR